MPDWNPNAPEVLGLEWLTTRNQTNRVWSGAPARMMRLPSTATETISQLRMSAAVNETLEADVRTLVDVYEEGNEDVGAVTITELAPAADDTINGWRTEAGASTGLFSSINEDPNVWGSPEQSPARDTWIQNTNANQEYRCSVDVTDFDTGGQFENDRILWVAVHAIYGANTGFRKLGTQLVVGGTRYNPAGGAVRSVHGYGAIYPFWWGELNPADGRPWTPADIAAFGAAGTSRLRVRSHAATTSHYPVVYAVALRVAHTTETREAVGGWRRPRRLTSRLQNVDTDFLVHPTTGAANWAKATAKNYLFYWRQSVSPSLYEGTVADDVRWHGVYQELPSNGEPSGVVYPLHHSGASPPSDVMASSRLAHDAFGRPVGTPDSFNASSRAAYGIVLERQTDSLPSADSQPYRLDLTDLAKIRGGTANVGQRVTPAASESYLGVRFPIVPPASGTSTLTVKIHRVSDDAQIGGTFTITAAAARTLPKLSGNLRYVEGLLSSGASLVAATQYEIRLSCDTGEWVVMSPNCSLGPEASFGNTADSFVSVNGTSVDTDRDLAVTLIKQPDPPTGATATIVNSAVTTFNDEATTIPNVEVAWTAPAVGLGASFSRYEIERQVAGGAWHRIANITSAGVVSHIDRETPRNKAATYRVRAVSIEGRFSMWATTAAATPTETRPMLILSSNHQPAVTFVHLYEITEPADAETVYPVLSTEDDEIVRIHGADYQVVFMTAEDRGVGWHTRVSLKQATVSAAGIARFDALFDLVRSLDVPYLCAMDHQGNQLLGHVSVPEGSQGQPDYRYSAPLEVIPTHTAPVAVEVV